MERATAGLLDDPSQLANWKRFVFSRMQVRDRVGKRSSYVPHSHQEKLHFPSDPKKVQVVVAGRRGGKTKGAVAEAVSMAGIEGTVTWVGAPTYALTDRVFKDVYQQLVVEKVYDKAPKAARYSSDQRYIEMPWGAIVEGKSAERPAGSKGAAIDLFIDDECAEHGEEFYTEYVGPGLADRQGRAIFISTPKGLTWFHDYYERACDPGFQEMGWQGLHWTSLDNPHLDREWLLQQQKVLPSFVWRQEYLAEFVVRSGLVWEDFRDELFDGPNAGHLFNPHEHDIPAGWAHYRSIDIGFQHPTACLWFAVDPDKNVWVYDEYLATSVLHQDHARAIKAKTQREIVDTYISWEAHAKDGKGTKTVQDIYGEEGIYTTRVPKSGWDVGIGVVAAYLRSTLQDSPVHPRVYISEKCEALRHQIKQYRFAELPEGGSTKAKPHRKGVDDDLCDALRYALLPRPEPHLAWMADSEESHWGRYGIPAQQWQRPSRGSRIGIPGLAQVPRA